MIRSRLAITAAMTSGLLSTAALGQDTCATRDDLASGIAVTYAHGGTDTFRANPAFPGSVIWQGEFEGMSLGTTVLAHGYIYLSSISPATGGEEVTYEYDVLPGDLPLPTPGGTWEGVAVVTAGGVASTERQSHVYGLAGTLTLGSCTWRMLPISIQYPENRESLFWFPDLGISVRSGDVVTGIVAIAAEMPGGDDPAPDQPAD